MEQTWLSVDIIALNNNTLTFIERLNEPYSKHITLPGGLLLSERGETIQQAAERIMLEKTGYSIGPVSVIDTISDPTRDDRGHTVSVIVIGRVMENKKPRNNVHFFSNIPENMPFAHSTLAHDAIGLAFSRVLEETKVARSVFGAQSQPINNFVQAYVNLAMLNNVTIGLPAARKKIDRSGLLKVDTGQRLQTKGRPGYYYVIK